MEPAFLDDRAVLAISGPQAREFLQGLVTNDVAGGLAPGSGLYTALLSPQGKILFDFLVTEGEGALLLDVARDARDALVKKLKMYKLRAKVDVEAREQLGVYVHLAGHPDNRPASYADRAVTFTDPRLAALGKRSIGARAEMPANLPGPRSYHEQRLALGLPEGGDFGFEKTFALDAGLEELNGVSFTKGCYIGQELTSRMKHRATSRKRILPVKAEAPLPAPGASVTRGGTEIGELVSVHGTQGFALVRLDRLEETSGDVSIGEIPVALSKPSWLAGRPAPSAEAARPLKE
jgi:folate-binding protein YgfZ